MKTSIVLITVELAKELLKKNDMNRPILQMEEYVINEYARQMVAGLWKEETGEAIKIAVDGTLLDGQLRLNALIKANISLPFLVISDLEKDVFTVIDSNLARTPSDYLYQLGIPNATNIAGGIRKYYALRSGYKVSVVVRNFSNQEMIILYNKRPKVYQAVFLMAQKWYKCSSRILTICEFMAIYLFFFDINEDAAFEFMSALGEGELLDRCHPVRLLREKLLFSKLNPKYSLLNNVKMALIYKAWNYYRKGTEITILRFSPTNEEFPTPI